MRKSDIENRPSNDNNEYAGPLFAIRWKWLLGTFAVLAVVVAALVGVYYLQTKDQTGFRIKIYRDAEEAGNWREGIHQLLLYQADKPDDMAIVRELAEAFDRNGAAPTDWKNAARFYQTLLGSVTSDGERLEILERILDNQRKAVDNTAMYPTIQRILELAPENPMAWKSLVVVRAPMLNTGVYQPGPGEPPFFDLLAKKALDLNSADVEVVSMYARLLRANAQNSLACMSPEFRNTPLETRAVEADTLMADFAKNNADSATALLADYEYRSYYKLLDPNATDLDPELKKILELEPNNPMAMMYVGIFHEQASARLRAGQGSDDYEEQRKAAIDQFTKMIAATPHNTLGYLQLAALYAMDGERDKQIEILEKANKAMRSSDLTVIVTLILAYLENNDVENANRNIRLIHDWVERNRGVASQDSIRACLQMASLLEGQSLAISNHPMEAIAKFKSVFEPVIPHQVDVRLVYNSLMIYARLLAETLNMDSAVMIYEQTLRYLESDTYMSDAMNFARMDRTYFAEINALEQLGQMGQLAVVLSRQIEFLRKELAQQPDNQPIRMTLAMALFRQIMMQPADHRDWTELTGLLDILRQEQLHVIPPWQVDFLQASVTWEKLGHATASLEEVLIPLRLAENRFNGDLGFLVTLEETYHNFNAQKDCDRVLEQIRTFPEGMPYWYLIKAMRADQAGNSLEARRLIDEALTQLPEAQKELFLTVRETLGRSLEENVSSLVRERQILEQLRKTNAENPTIQTLFEQGLMELDFGNGARVDELTAKLRKLEGNEGTLSLFLESERLLQEATDAKDPKIEIVRTRQKTLLAKRPNWEYTYILAADIEDKVGNEQGIIDALVKAIDAGNRDPMRHRDLIELYGRKGQAAEAQRALERSAVLFPNLMTGMHFRFDPPYQVLFLNFLRAIRREDATTARQIAEQWITLAQKNNVPPEQLAIFRSMIGQNFFNIDQLATAEKYFKEAAQGGGETVLPLAKYYAQTGKMQQALQMVYDEMTRSQTPEAFLLPALGLMRDHDYDPGWVEPYDAYVGEFDPSKTTDAAKLFQYVQYWLIRGMNDRTLPLYRRMNELSGNNVTILNDLAYLIAFRKSDDKAVKDADFREARGLIDKAINLEENNAMIVDTKGLIVMAQGLPAEAVPLFEKAVSLSNQSIIFRLHLAVAQLRAGQKDLAEKEFAAIRTLLVPQIELLPERNRDYTRELLDAFPEK